MKTAAVCIALFVVSFVLDVIGRSLLNIPAEGSFWGLFLLHMAGAATLMACAIAVEAITGKREAKEG